MKGEFVKRIKSIFPTKTEVKDSTAKITFNLELYTLEFLKVVNEAQKEFQTLERRKEDEYGLKFEIDVHSLIEKWFGDEKMTPHKLPKPFKRPRIKGEFEKRMVNVKKELQKYWDKPIQQFDTQIIVDINHALDEDLKVIVEARKEFPKFGGFTHAPPDDLTAGDFLDASILEFADFHGYIMAIKEYRKKWFGTEPKTNEK